MAPARLDQDEGSVKTWRESVITFLAIIAVVIAALLMYQILLSFVGSSGQ